MGFETTAGDPGGWRCRVNHVVLALAVSLLALSQSIPVHAGIYNPPANAALNWLESQQDTSDGSWHDTVSEVSTFLQTAEAVTAFDRYNRRNASYYAGQTWIENHEPRNIDTRARRLLVLRAQSSAQQDIAALLEAVSVPSTGQAGWGLAQRYRASPLDTALALDALRTIGASFSSAQAIAYLKGTQIQTPTQERGWPSAEGTSADPYTTARVVQALSAYRDSDPTLATPLANAVATLKTKVTTASFPHIRAVAALAYLRMDPNDPAARTLLDSLLAIQLPNGGFSAGVFTTGLIVQAFAVIEGKDVSNDRLRVDTIDAALRTAINEALGRNALDDLNRGEIGSLTTLNIANRGITSLQGLQYATNLTTLYAANNLITDTGPISGLNLAFSDLAGNPCCDSWGAPDGDVPLPAWALAMLGAALMGAVGRAGRRGRRGE